MCGVALEILQAFAEVCEKNGLKYFLVAGTLLGAVRHQGFIPWDDDIDVCMPWSDYCRFLDIGQKELGDKYFVQTTKTDSNWYRPHAKIRMNGTAMFEKSMMNYHIHQGIWIDVFILTGINNRLEFLVKRKLITISNYIQADDYFLAIGKENMKKELGKYPMSVS